MNPIAILDYSIVSPLGWGNADNWAHLFSPSFEPRYKLGVNEFELTDHLFSELNHHIEGIAPDRIGVVLSNSKYNFGANGIDFFPHSLSAYLATKIGPGCIPYAVSAACATGLLSVIKGCEMIERGLVDVVIAGSLETSIVPIIEAAFSQMGVLSSSTRMAPFTMGRDGFVLGEGGGLFILRRMAEVESAKGVINGYAYGNDSYHPVEFDPSGRSIIRIMTEAMRDAGQGTVDYINAHGTGTRLNDEVEARAFQKVFSSGQKPYISSTKAHTGHLLGATGSVELGLCLLSLEYEAFIPQKNLIDPMPEMALFLTPRILCPPATCLTLNYGFGGHLAALMIARP